MSTKPLLYIQREGTEAGPYDLVQMAGLLRRKIIDAETPTRLDGDDAWKPFSWQPQYNIVCEIPPDAVSMRLDELNEEALDSRSSIPLPSRESVLRLAAALVVVLLLGCGAFLLAWLDQTLGIILAAVGVGMAVTASALIYTRKLDEGYGRLFGMMFVPLYDWYYMITNLSVYSRWLWLKYTGIAIAFGAMWGLAMHK